MLKKLSKNKEGGAKIEQFFSNRIYNTHRIYFELYTRICLVYGNIVIKVIFIHGTITSFPLAPPVCAITSRKASLPPPAPSASAYRRPIAGLTHPSGPSAVPALKKLSASRSSAPGMLKCDTPTIETSFIRSNAGSNVTL